MTPAWPGALGAASNGEDGSRAHFGFSRSNRLAQMTGSETIGPLSPTPTVSGTPSPATQTPVGTVSPSPSPGTTTPTPALTGTPGLPAAGSFPSKGYVIAGLPAGVGPLTPGPTGTTSVFATATGTPVTFAAPRGFRASADGSSCTPSVRVTTSPNGLVTVSTAATASPPGDDTNVLSIAFPAAGFENAYVAFADATLSRESLDATYVLAQPAKILTFWLSPVLAGQPIMVPFTVTDGCGTWQTFAGIGTSQTVALDCMRVDGVPAGSDHNPPYLNGETVGGVHTLTGSYSTSHSDVSIAGRGPTPKFTRTYNSNDARSGPLGLGWTHSYAMHLARPPDGSADLLLVGASGRTDRYANAGGGAYTPPLAVFTTLAKSGTSYVATAKDQTTWTFDNCGRLASIADRYGNVSTLNYDGATKRLLTIDDPAARGSLSLGYDGAGRLLSVSDWAGRVVTFAYDSANRLQSVVDRQNNTVIGTKPATTFGYSTTTYRLTTITNANSHLVVSNTYDPTTGKVTSQQDAASNVTTFDYVGFVTTITQPTTSFEPSFQPTIVDTYDSSGWLASRQTHPSSGEPTYMVSYTYNTIGARATVTDARNAVTTYCYDLGYDGLPVPNSRGNLTRKIQPPVSVQPNPASTPVVIQPTTLYKYDGKNNLVEAYPPKGVGTGAVVACSTSLSGVLNSGYAVTRGYDATLTKLTSTTEQFYDPALGPQTATTQYFYDDAANPGLVTRVVSPRGNTTTSAYYGADSPSQAGLLKSQTTPPTVESPTGAKTTYTYDSVGRRLTMTDAMGNAAGGNPTQHTWTYTYDNEDRQLTVTSPPVTIHTPGSTGLLTTYVYDTVGNRITMIDARDPRQTTRYVYDQRELLVQTQQSPTVGADPATDNGAIWTTHTYDKYGAVQRTTRATRANHLVGSYSRAFDYQRDGAGRPRAEIQYPNWPATTTPLVTSYVYDGNGNQTGVTRPKNQPISYGYDALNRRTSINYTDPNTPDVIYTYDAHGKRVTMTDGAGVTRYEYDERDQLLCVGFGNYTCAGGTGRIVRYRYNLDGQRRRILYPPGVGGSALYFVDYTIDAAGRLAAIDDWQSRHTGYEYRPDGKLLRINNFNNTKQTLDYDNAGRLTLASNTLNSVVIVQDVYTLDGLGNAASTSVNGSVSDTLVSTFDGLNRLTHFNDTSGTIGTINYQYDVANNRQQLTHNGATDVYTYDTADRLQTVAGVAYAYDANGNVLGHGATAFTYDNADRLTSVTLPVGGTTCSVTLIYDGDGRRTARLPSGCTSQSHQYVDDVSGSLPTVIADGTLFYIRGMGLAYTLDVATTTPRVYHTDGRGSVRALTDASGSVVQDYHYDPSGVRTTTGASQQVLGFTGEPQTLDDGLIYLRARTYDPSIGRFLQRDTLLPDPNNPDSLNRFTYAGNNPSSNSDPTGHFFLPFMGGWGFPMGWAGFGLGRLTSPYGPMMDPLPWWENWGAPNPVVPPSAPGDGRVYIFPWGPELRPYSGMANAGRNIGGGELNMRYPNYRDFLGEYWRESYGRPGASTQPWGNPNSWGIIGLGLGSLFAPPGSWGAPFGGPVPEGMLWPGSGCTTPFESPGVFPPALNPLGRC
jgi:RHS repeat-associated protein